MRLPAAVCLAALVAACAQSESSTADSAVTAAVGPAPLTEADLDGTWTGTATMAGTDSVLAHWSATCAGGGCTRTSQEAPAAVTTTHTMSADSATFVSAPFVDPQLKANVVDHGVFRLTAPGAMSGHGWVTLADKPDSVVTRYTFEGTKK